MSRPVRAGRVEVRWLIPEQLDAAALARAEAALLSPDERDRVALARSPRARATAVAARALVRLALADHTGLAPSALRFGATERERPTLLGPALPGPDLDFNLTHTDGLVACALARGLSVGLDAEALDARPARLELAERYFSAEERAELAALPEGARPARYFALWTLKEAFLKAAGLGLGALQAPSFSFATGAPALRSTPPAASSTAPTVSAAPWVFRRLTLTPRHETVLAITGPASVLGGLELSVAPVELP